MTHMLGVGLRKNTTKHEVETYEYKQIAGRENFCDVASISLADQLTAWLRRSPHN